MLEVKFYTKKADNRQESCRQTINDQQHRDSHSAVFVLHTAAPHSGSLSQPAMLQKRSTGHRREAYLSTSIGDYSTRHRNTAPIPD